VKFSNYTHTNENSRRNFHYFYKKILSFVIARSDNPASVRPLHELLLSRACGLPCGKSEASAASCPAKHGVGHETAGSETGTQGVSQAVPEKPAFGERATGLEFIDLKNQL
jgi:hypothetical protein